jgi:hypothetical protein
MATYEGLQAHLWSYAGNPGHVECLCGESVELCTGGHVCTRKPPNSTGEWPNCKFCGEEISLVNSGPFGCIPVANPNLQRVLWEKVGCKPSCRGYEFDGKTTKPKPVPIPLPGRIAIPEKQLEQRRILLEERLRQVFFIARALRHELPLVALDIYNDAAVTLNCERCSDHVSINMTTNPQLPFKGPAVMFRCRSI